MYNQNNMQNLMKNKILVNLIISAFVKNEEDIKDFYIKTLKKKFLKNEILITFINKSSKQIDESNYRKIFKKLHETVTKSLKDTLNQDVDNITIKIKRQ